MARSSRAAVVLGGACFVLSCGSPDGGGSGGGTPMGGGDPLPPEPQCFTVDVNTGYAGEKTEAAFCFGLAYSENYRCVFDGVNNATLCEGQTTGFYVLWEEQVSGTLGIAYDILNDEEIGRLVQGRTGSFVINFSQLGVVGDCTVVGDVVTLCIEP